MTASKLKRRPRQVQPQVSPSVWVYLDHGVPPDDVCRLLNVDPQVVTTALEMRIQRRVENNHNYWDDTVRAAVNLYVCLDPVRDADVRHRLYQGHIHLGTHRLVQVLVNQMKASWDVGFADLVSETQSDLYLKLDKFDPTRNTNSFSYFTIVAKNILFQRWRRVKTLHHRQVVVLDDDDNHIEEPSVEPNETTLPTGILQDYASYVWSTPQPSGTQDLSISRLLRLRRAASFLATLDVDLVDHMIDSDTAHREGSSRLRASLQKTLMVELGCSHTAAYQVLRDLRTSLKAWLEEQGL